ncbi:MAG: ATP-dependent DNA helicase RecG [Patescibacteria group bacterium]
MKLSDIKGVGSVVISDFSKIGINSVTDLIDNYPRRYEDYSKIEKIKDLSIGQVSIKAKITHVSGRYVRRGMHITEAIASDGTGSVKLVWFNQPYRKNGISAGKDYYISGNFDLKRSQFSITSPSAELVSDFPVNTARILPIYKETKTLKSTKIRKIYVELFKSIKPEDIIDWLPTEVKETSQYISRFEAIYKIHVPQNAQDIVEARKRLTFDELFIAMFASQLNKQELRLHKSPKFGYTEADTDDLKKLTDSLEFDLTDDQRRITWQVIQDLSKDQPMNRIVEGDVGSGKTMVAMFASVFALRKNAQIAIMSPTEILARQHYKTFTDYLSKVGYSDEVKLLVGSQKAKEKSEVRDYFSKGNRGIMVGTHSLIAKGTSFTDLSLVVIDEQHRFGVEQRKSLKSESKLSPHFLSMTATPIPRTLALTIFGELDISIIHDKPPGRKEIITKLVSWDDRVSVFDPIKEEIKNKRQVFVVCPTIDVSSSLAVKSVGEIVDIYKKALPDAKIESIHGRIKQEERDQTMSDFAEGKIDILVSTTVIEVGVDMPNASVMVIESAERFGLAQIHQLRGRVGRGKWQGYCYLIPTDKQSNTYRLDKMTTVSDGFKLAEFDLKLRGPGAVYGSLQHGSLDFRMVDISDVKMIESTSQLAKKYVKSLDIDKYPLFKDRVKQFQIFSTLN